MPRVAVVVFLVLVTGPAAAGVAELSLDRGTVQDLLAAALPSTLDVELRGIGTTTLELGAPTRTAFVDGAVETTLPVRLPAAGLAHDVRLRFVPEIEPLYGTPLLRPASARIEGTPLDLAALLPPAELPRRAEWSVPGDATSPGEGFTVLCFVQGVTVEADRLRLDLGLRIAAPGSRPD